MYAVSRLLVVVSALLALSVAGCGGGSSGGGAVNSPPEIGQPTGPGTVGGADPDYTTEVTVGDLLDLDVTVTDPDLADDLTLVATVTGGNLTPLQAGFTTSFPATVNGTSPQTLSVAGTAGGGGWIELTLDADDGRLLTDTITLTIDINTPPLIGAPSGPGTVGGLDPAYDTKVNTGDSLNFTVTATDVDATDTLTFAAAVTGGTLTPAQAGLTLSTLASGPSPQVLQFTGTALAAGDIQLTFDVDDGLSGTDSITYAITINAAPLIGAPSGPGVVAGSYPTYTSTVTLGGSLVFDVVASDTDASDTLTFTATVTGGTLTPAQAGFVEIFPSVSSGPSPRTLSFTGTSAMLGDIEITFDVDDGQGATDLITHRIRFNGFPQIAPPSGPGVVGGADPAFTTSANPGDSLFFTLMATDANVGDVIILSVAVTGGTLTETEAGFAPLPPPAIGLSPQTLSFTGTGGVLTGDVELTFTVDDGRGGTDLATHTITINSPPAIGTPTGPGPVTGADPAYAAMVNLGDSLAFGITATDPNLADILTFTATVTGGSLTPGAAGFNEVFPSQVTGTSPRNLPFTGTAGMPGDIVFTFDVNDGVGPGLSDLVTLTLTINAPPAIGTPSGPGSVTGTDPAYATTVNPGDLLDFTVTATDADAADNLTFTATVTGGTLTPAQAGFNELFPFQVSGPSPQPLDLTGTAGTSGLIVLTLDVDDGQGNTDQITFAITINSPPAIGTPTGPGPVTGADPAYAAMVNLGDSLAFGITATDPNLADILTFTATVTGGSLTPGAAGFNEVFPSQVTGTSPRNLPFTGTAGMPGDIVFTFDVNDGVGPGLSDLVTLTLTINAPPAIGTPSGPGSVTGTDPAYATTVNPGDLLDFTVTATDADAADNLTFTATVTGGTLTPAQAGFNELFPFQVSGPSPQPLDLTGTAGTSGLIVLTLDVDDGQGNTDQITFAITINSSPAIGTPTGPGSVIGGPAFVTTVNLGDSLAFSVTATDLNLGDALTFDVNTGGGTLTPAQAGILEVIPDTLIGGSPRTFAFTGTAALAGDVVLTFDVTDVWGLSDSITLTININTPPVVGAPNGPGVVGGGDPTYSTTIFIGDPLDFQIDGDDVDGDFINFTASVTGGTLTEVQAGFNETFPVSDSGIPVRTLVFTGTAAMAGTVEITFDVDDGRGGTDVVTFTITIIPDVTAPADITDLSAAYSGVLDTIEISWTASGDDGMTGTASVYVLKFSTTPITNDAEFLAATTFPQAWSPLPGGSTETKTVDLTLVGYGWYMGNGYFSIKAEDEVPNSSGFTGDLAVNTDLATTFPGATYSYGDVDFRNAVTNDFMVTNNATLVDLVITLVTILGDPEFGITAGGGGPFTIMPGSTHTATVEYLPLGIASHGGTLSIDHNDAAATDPYLITLTGNGVNAAPQITASTFSSHPSLASSPVTVTIEVTDNNHDLPATNDLASVNLDLSAVGGPPAQPMTFVTNGGAKVAVYDHTFITAPLDGVFDLPVTVTDAAGATETRVLSHVVYTGTVLDIPTALYPTIQDGINAAVPPGDVVRVLDGAYVGIGNKNLIVGGKPITVMSQNGPASTIIDCEGNGRGFLFDNSAETPATVVLGFTIQNASASGIYCFTNASPTIRDCIFTGNTSSSHGGAMLLDGPTVAPVITGCTFDANIATPGSFNGGAIYATGGSTVTVERCAFTNNQARGGGAIGSDTATLLTILDCQFTGNQAFGDRGGAVYLVGGTSTITNSTFTLNETFAISPQGDGGALYLEEDCTITTCTFTSNTAGRAGGAFSARGAVIVNLDGCLFDGNLGTGGGAFFTENQPTSMSFTDCIFSGNQSTTGRGGAVLSQAGVSGLTFSNCLFDGNTAAGDGGGVLIEGGSPISPNRLLNCTISGNTGNRGGGVCILPAVAGTNVEITDTIIWGNTDALNGDELYVENAINITVNITFCDIDDSPGGIDDLGLRINPLVGWSPPLGGNFSLDPLFVTGPRGDFYLSQLLSGEGVDSPCLDTGSDTAANLGLAGLTTRSDAIPDAGVVDIGFHYEP